MRYLLLGACLLVSPLFTHAQTELDQLLDGLDIELDDSSKQALQDWIKSIDDVSFEWSSDFDARERRRIGRRYEELITVRSADTRLFVYGGRRDRKDELLLVARLDTSYVRLSLLGDFDFR